MPESQDQNLVLTVLYVPCLLDSVGVERLGGMTAEMWSGSEEGSYLRLIYYCITQLEARE